MRFDSLDYLLLLAVTAGLFFRLPPLARVILLCGASLVFYAVWNIPLTGLILLSAAVDYIASRQIEAAETQGRRKLFLGLSLAVNLGLLGYFKYANFFAENIALLSGHDVGRFAEVVLPPGISFYTFQTMSYSIDVYRGQIPAARSWWRYLAYVSFFPQLIAGPIERAGRILGQLETAAVERFQLDNLVVGGRLILWGLFKKVMIADHVGVLADRVYADPEGASLVRFLVGTYAFTLQIYCDFSAYSEIARGSARIFGIRLVRNFDQPYLVTTPRDFWRHWHISLSEWFRDYVYLPLGGSRGGRASTLTNLTITMFLSGLWHGAAWNYVIWGLFHGVLLVAHQLGRKTAPVRAAFTASPRLATFASWLLTFQLVVAGWVLFRVASMADLATMLGAAWSDWSAPTPGEAGFLGFVLLFLVGSQASRRGDWFGRLHQRPALSAVFYAALATLTLALGRTDGPAFIYFQF